MHKISIQRVQFAAIALLFAGFCAYGDSEPYGKLPLSFEPNHGQTSSSVQWLARGPEYTLYLAGADAVLQLNKTTLTERGSANATEYRPQITSSAVLMRLLGAKAAQQSTGEEPQCGKANYFSGNDPAKWQHDVPMYGKVRMPSVYPGVDLVYYGRQGQLEYDFVLAPGADASAIRLQFDGATPSLAANGDLVLAVEGGEEIRFNKPAVYQTKDGVRQPVEGRFAINTRKQVSFHLGAYDRSRELVIDPTLDFLGILGTGSYGTTPNGMTVDALGEMILTGYTYDLDFPASAGAYQTTCGAVAGSSLVRCGPNRSNSFSSAFVAKISADGGSLVYATYLHGLSGYESGVSVAADLAGNAYVLGSTSSDDFPITADAYQSLCNPYYPLIGVTGSSPSDYYPIAPTCYGGGSESGGPSLFISKLNGTGSTLLYSSFFGGTAAAYPVAIALDSTNNIYFTSQLSQAPASYYPTGTLIPFPTAAPTAPGPITSPANAYQPSGPVNAAYQPFGVGGPAATLSKLSADGHILLYSTLLSSLNQGIYRPSITSQALAVGPNGIAYIGGMTNESSAVCTPSNGPCNGFPVTPGVVKQSCVVSGGNSGNCVSPTGFLSAFDTTQSGSDSLVYSTLIGGTEAGGNATQQVLGLAADSSNNVYVTGNTEATDYPTTAGAYQTTCTLHGSVCNAAFLSKINPTGTAYVWSTLYGADQPNLYSIGEAVGLDGQGQVCLYGLAASGGADYVNPIQPPKYGSDKPFIGMFSADGSTLIFATQVGNSSTTTNENDEPIPSGGLAIDAAANMYFAGYTADGGQLTPTPGAYANAAVSAGNRAFFGKISCLATPCPSLPPPLSNSIALAVSPNITSLGQTVTMTATVTGQQSQPAPTGLVGFYNGSSWLGNATLNSNGIATFSSSSLPAGAYTVTAVYLGDHLYPGATSTAQSLTISSPAATTTTASNAYLTYSANTQQVTLTATVMSASGVVNTGFVGFTISGILYAQPPLAAVQNGTASVTITFGGLPLLAAPKVGSYPIAVGYMDPTSTFATSTDSTKQLTISIATPVITWASPAAISTGTALGSTQLNATANTAGTFVYNPPSGTVLATGSGQTLSTTFTPADATDYTTATASVTIAVGGPNSTTTVASNAQVTYSQSSQPVTLTATVTSPSGVVNSGTVNFSVTFLATPYTASAPVVNGAASASLTIPAGNFVAVPGSYPIAVAYMPSGNLLASSDNTRQLTISAAPLVITWATPAPIANGTPLEFGQLNAAVSPAAAFATCVYTPPAGTVLPGPGTYTLSVTCTPGLAGYTAATATVSIQVEKIPLTIAWATPAPIANGTALGSAQLNAIASPSAALATCVYTPPSGTVLSGPGASTLSVTCTPASNESANFTAATATVSVQVVTPQALTITWATPAPIANGTPLLVAPATVSPGGAFATCVYTPPAGTVLPGPGTYTLSVTCTPAIPNYIAATAAVSIQVLAVAKTTPSIAWATPASITVGTPLSGTQLNATAVAGTPLSSSVPGTFVYNPPLGTVLPVGNNESLTVTFTPTDTTSYQTATAKVYINVISTAVSVSAETAIIPFSASTTTATLTANVTNASSTGGVSFTMLGITTGQGRVVNGVVSAIATIPGGMQAGSYPFVANYSDPLNPSITASSTANLVISPPKVTLTASSLTTAYSTSALVVTMTANVANATSSGYVVFQSPAGTSNGAVAHVVNGVASGSFTIAAGTPVGTYPITADYSDPLNPSVFASATATLTILQTALITSMIAWAAPTAIFSGTALSSAQLNATANVPGTFVYNPPVGTVLPVGYAQVLSVVFAPANPALYTTATATVSISVLPPVTVVPANLTVQYSPTSQTVPASATVTNGATYTLTFSLLGSTVTSATDTPQATLTIPAGTASGAYPIVATYLDTFSGLTATGTSQLTVMAPPASSCPAPTTSSDSSSQFKVQGPPNGSVLNPGDAPVTLTRRNDLKKNIGNPLLPPTQSNLMISGSIQVNNDGTGGYALQTTLVDQSSFQIATVTSGAYRVTVNGGTYVSELDGSATTLTPCISALVDSPAPLPVVLEVTPLTTLIDTMLVATVQDPVTQDVFGLQLVQQVPWPGSTATASSTHQSGAKLVEPRLLVASGAASINLDSPALAGLPGASLIFSGTLANSSGADQYINGAEVILNGFTYTSFGATDFLVSAPPILTNGTTTSSFDFFNITIPGQFASGPYRGQLGVFGGSTSTAQDLLGIVNFTVQVGGAATSPPGACDINGDGVANVADVQAILNQALGTSPYVAGDLNGDGAINVVDVEFVIDAALNYGCAAIGTGTSSVTATANRITAAKAVDAQGNVYTIDTSTNRIRKLSPDGTISTLVVAGLDRPTGVAVDAAGNLYIAESGSHRVFKLVAGEITTVEQRR